MVNEIINEYFDGKFDGNGPVWDARQKVSTQLERSGVAPDLLNQVEEAISEYIYQAEKRAIIWTYSRCAMVVFDLLMMSQEDAG